MFTTSVKGGKAFAAKQKIRELKTRVSKLNTEKLKMPPTKIILNSANNITNVQSEKYGFSSEEIERKSLSNKRFRAMFYMHNIEKTNYCAIDSKDMMTKNIKPRKKIERKIKYW